MFIRAAQADDADGIAYVHVNAWLETYRGLIPDEVLDILSVECRWRKSLDDPADLYHLALVAEEDKHIVGFANYGRELENDPDYRGELYALYILKQFQGKGVGSALLQRSALDLLVLGISSMLVWVLSENPHRKFYERLGGVYLREKPIEFGNKTLQVSAYGWRDIRHVAG